jgi:hypothetical protein
VADATKGPAALRAEADHLRRLARGITEERMLGEIRRMIEELERRATALEEDTDGEA